MTRSRDQRLDIRFSSLDRELLQLAAEVDGRDLTSFVLQAALAQAREVLARSQRLELESQEATRALKALAAPLHPTPALIAALRARLGGDK